MADYKELSNQYYNLTTGAYRAYFGEHFHLFFWRKGESRDQAIRKTNQRFLSDAKLTSQSVVLDAGCGIGSLSILVAKQFRSTVTGININTHQLSIARKRATQEKLLNVTFLEKDLMKFDARDAFSSVFYIDAEPHMPDKERVIRNLKRSLQPGGRLVMTAWLQKEKPNFAQKEFLLAPYCRVAAFPYLETFAGYRSIFEREKLRIIRFEDVTKKMQRSVDDFYSNLFSIIEKYSSLKDILKIVDFGVFVKSFSITRLRQAVHDAFLGPVYAKLCLDAGIFKLGYFVLEKPL